MNIASQSSSAISGIYTFTECDCSSREARVMSLLIQKARDAGINTRELMNEFHARFAVRKTTVRNVVTTGGRAATAQFWTKNPSEVSLAESPKISHMSVGTGTAAPVESNTALGNEVFKGVINDQSLNGTKVFNMIFLGYNEANGHVISEAGLWAGGGDLLMSHVLVVPPFAKTSEKTLTIDATHTFTSA